MKEPSRFLPFLPDFFPDTPLFFPIFDQFFAVGVGGVGGTLPLAPVLATPLQVDSPVIFTLNAVVINADLHQKIKVE